MVERHRREPSYRPIMIVQDATLAQVAAVKARRLDFELPDIVVEQVPTRQYPEAMAAHLFGYVGEVNDAQVTDSDGLKSGDIVGQAGIEKVYNSLLMGADGAKRVVVNSVGREIRVLDEDPPTEGKRLQLTIDADVQKAVEDAFKASGFNGASVVLDPSNGDVLASPAFRPTTRTRSRPGVDRATWAALNTDELRPLNDRAIQGRYSPGSTFKMAVALAGLEEGHHHARLPRPLRRPREFLRPRLQVLEEGRARLDRSAPRHRTVVRRLFLHRRQHGRRRQDQQVGDAARARRQERHRPAERSAGAGAVHRVEAREDAREVVRGRDHFGRRSARARCR